MFDTIAVTVGSILLGHMFVLLTTRLLPWLFPFRPAPRQTRWTLKQLERLYARVDRRMIYLWACGWVVPAVGWYLILKVLAVIVYPDPEPRGMIMTPSDFYWMAVAFLAGGLTVFAAQRPILKRTLKHRYMQYRLYKKWKSGRARPVLGGIAMAGVGLLLVVATFLLAVTYTAFMPGRMVIAHGYGATQTYRYDDIVELRAVTQQSSETKKQMSWYEIEFYDGTVWDAGNVYRFADPCGTFPFIAFAADKSRKEITGPDFLAEGGCR